MNLEGKRILIIKQSSLGDIVHTLPLVHALKRCYPACQIGWIVEKGLSALVANDPAVDTVYPIHIPSTSEPGAGRFVYGRALAATWRTLRNLRSAFRAHPYDIVLDLHASFRSGLLGLTNPGGLRFGFADAKELNPLFQHHLVKNETGVEHALDKNLLFCAPLACPPDPADLYLCASEEDHKQMQAFLAHEGLGKEDRLVYVNATARWQSKFWLSSRWAELCCQLQASKVQPIFGGSREDLPYIEEITRSMPQHAIVAAGRLSLTESVALMQRAAAYVGLDTGPMHMAALCGTPVVALFGPTHPERVGPYGAGHTIIQAEEVACLCCRKRQCATPRCMEGISVAAVYERVMAYVQQNSVRQRERLCGSV